jgi:hypothetical protein
VLAMPAELAPVVETPVVETPMAEVIIVVIEELEGEKRRAKAKGWSKEVSIIIKASSAMPMPAPPFAPPFSAMPPVHLLHEAIAHLWRGHSSAQSAGKRAG